MKIISESKNEKLFSEHIDYETIELKLIKLKQISVI